MTRFGWMTGMMRPFANINMAEIKPQNSVLKVYNQLVETKQIEEDPNQVAIINAL